MLPVCPYLLITGFKYRVSSEETVETNTTLLPKGNIDGIQPRGERLKARIKYPACGPDEYLTVNTDDTLSLSVPLPATADNGMKSTQIYTWKKVREHLIFEV